MRETIIHWMYTIFGGLIIGPIAGMLAASIAGLGGAPDATGLASSGGLSGLIAMLAVVVLAGVVMVIGGFLGFVRRAFFVSGAVLCWAAFQAGTIPGVLRAANGEGVFVKLAIEGLILGAVYSGFAWITVSIRRKKDDSFTLPGPRDGLAILACVLVG